jgi:hypothetical protein
VTFAKGVHAEQQERERCNFIPRRSPNSVNKVLSIWLAMDTFLAMVMNVASTPTEKGNAPALVAFPH